ncbi:MAG: hypothetical protein IE909_10190 [Campylobacterales bacterium]|nr:hypothetical protein [Campylobacterota bacterium]MBD3842236.1 hypothetical protein [Campylobacterales bacterium]
MKKVLLLEDKLERDSLKNANIDFNKFNNLKAIFGKSACNSILNDFEQFDTFEIIIVHASIEYDEEQDVIQEIKKYCNEKNKTLVTFSGAGDIGSLRSNTLEITAKSFYTNLPIFMKHYPETSHVLMLAYGENWSLNIFLNTLEKLNIFIENNDENLIEDYDDFEDDFDLIRLKSIIGIEEYASKISKNKNNNQTIEMSQIKTIRDNLIEIIEEQVYA